MLRGRQQKKQRVGCKARQGKASAKSLETGTITVCWGCASSVLPRSINSTTSTFYINYWNSTIFCFIFKYRMRINTVVVHNTFRGNYSKSWNFLCWQLWQVRMTTVSAYLGLFYRTRCPCFLVNDTLFIRPAIIFQ